MSTIHLVKVLPLASLESMTGMRGTVRGALVVLGGIIGDDEEITSETLSEGVGYDVFTSLPCCRMAAS